jgi:hypothetical protein
MATALAALMKAMQGQLRGEPLWGSRVYADIAPAKVQRPYVIFFVVSGGEENRRQIGDARFVMTVKCVAEKQAEALHGADRLEARLNDAGSQDDKAFACGDGWVITTCTQDRLVHAVEMFGEAQPIYHDGHQYIVVMEEI